MTKTEKATMKKALMICYKYGELYAASYIEDVAGITLNTKPEHSADIMTDEEADTLGDAINICDKYGLFGTGDIILTAIINHREND